MSVNGLPSTPSRSSSNFSYALYLVMSPLPVLGSKKPFLVTSIMSKAIKPSNAAIVCLNVGFGSR